MEVKRTIIGKGKHPTFEDSFMVPLDTQMLEFVVLDKEGGLFKKKDDIVGGGLWNCAGLGASGTQPFESTHSNSLAFVPIEHNGKPAGRVILQVYLGGATLNPQQGFGGQMYPSTIPYQPQLMVASTLQPMQTSYLGPPGVFPQNNFRF